MTVPGDAAGRQRRAVRSVIAALDCTPFGRTAGTETTNRAAVADSAVTHRSLPRRGAVRIEALQPQESWQLHEHVSEADGGATVFGPDDHGGHRHAVGGSR